MHVCLILLPCYGFHDNGFKYDCDSSPQQQARMTGLYIDIYDTDLSHLKWMRGRNEIRDVYNNYLYSKKYDKISR